MQPIPIELPEPVMRQLLRMAAATQQSIETLVAQSVLSNLPPSAENAPPEIQAELLALQTLSTYELVAMLFWCSCVLRRGTGRGASGGGSTQSVGTRDERKPSIVATQNVATMSMAILCP
jgi:hypothetical protein